jgi:hypothetical protein
VVTAGALTFGIYPGSLVGVAGLDGPSDQPDRILQALAELQGEAGQPFLVRAYEAFADPGDDARHTALRQTPEGYVRYAGRARMLDLVAQYQSRSGDIDGYCAFIEGLIERHGEHIATLQVGEEPNVTGDPALDGFYPRVTEALIAGVRAAKDAARRVGLPEVKVGCNTAPLLGPASGFLADLTAAGGERFVADLDYIGLDFFPDVFRPLPSANLAAAAGALLDEHRRDRMTRAGLGHLPLVITEHGWPTGPGRTPERQAEVLRTVVGVIARNAAPLNITGYIHHALRDARSDGAGLLCQFGLMTDDYTPKPAFGVYRDLIVNGS